VKLTRVVQCKAEYEQGLAIGYIVNMMVVFFIVSVANLIAAIIGYGAVDIALMSIAQHVYVMPFYVMVPCAILLVRNWKSTINFLLE